MCWDEERAERNAALHPVQQRNCRAEIRLKSKEHVGAPVPEGMDFLLHWGQAEL